MSGPQARPRRHDLSQPRRCAGRHGLLGLLERHRASALNVADPDSRNLKTTRGFVQGYNAQAAVTAEQIVVAAEVSIE